MRERSSTSSPSLISRRSASSGLTSTASRIAPVSASFEACTIELNCFPRRVETANSPSVGHRGRRIDAQRSAPARPESGTPTPRTGAARRTETGRRPRAALRCRGRTAQPARSPRAVPGCRRTREVLAQLRAHPAGQLQQHLPLRSRLPDPPAFDLRRHDHAALGRRLGDAARDLVARRGGQQQHRLARDRPASALESTMSCGRAAAWWPAPRRRRPGPASASRKLPPTRYSTSSSPASAASIISAPSCPCAAGTSKPHCCRQRAGVLGVDRHAAGEGRRVGAHLGAALHAGVTADRHQAAALAADEAARQAPG